MANTIEAMAPEEILRGIIKNGTVGFDEAFVKSIAGYKLRNYNAAPSLMVFREVTSIGSYAFYGISNSNNQIAVGLHKVTSTPGYAFTGNGLVLVLPKVTSLAKFTFREGTPPKVIDIGPDLKTIVDGTFYNYYSSNVETFILRSPTMVSLASINSLGNYRGSKNAACWHTNFVVPEDLIESYQSATNWSSLISQNGMTFSALEGSEYENYYADGTPIEIEGGVTRSILLAVLIAAELIHHSFSGKEVRAHG